MRMRLAAYTEGTCQCLDTNAWSFTVTPVGRHGVVLRHRGSFGFTNSSVGQRVHSRRHKISALVPTLSAQEVESEP
jgi:hypothetical protein